MAQQTINVGTAPNDGTGTPLRTAFQYTNSNFSELYTAVGPSGNNIVVPGSATITGDLTVDTSTLKVTASTDTVTVGATTTDAKFRVVDASYNGLRIGFLPGTANYNLYDATVHEFRTANVTPQQLYTLQASSSVWYDGAGGTRMTLNSTGLGVGVTPTNYGATFRTLAVNATDAGILDLMSNSVSQFRIFGNGLENRLGGITNVPMTFHTNNTERARIDASGNLLVGKTATGVGTVGNEIKAVGEFYSTQSASTDANFTYHVYSTGAAAYRFYVGLGGTVYATNTTISAISDARLKENVQDIDVGLDAILALKPRKFDWKNGKGKNIKGDRGFIAQEFETVFPNLVDEWKDPAPEGEAPYKSVRQDLIPVLVKAIQELAARVQTLETR